MFPYMIIIARASRACQVLDESFFNVSFNIDI